MSLLTVVIPYRFQPPFNFCSIANRIRICFYVFLTNDCTLYTGAACVCFYGWLTALHSLLRGCLRLITYISQFRLTQLCGGGGVYLFHYYCVLCSGFYVRELSPRHLSVKHVLIINLLLCLSCKIQLTVYRSLFTYEKSDSV
jgi:hypothetical protein